VQPTADTGWGKVAGHGAPATEPPCRGPVVDAHAHFDTGGRRCARELLAAGGPRMVINYWDLTWPPPPFPRWLERWREEHALGMRLLHAPDLSEVGAPGFERRLADGIAEAGRLGAVGVKVWKNLGLTLRDAAGTLLRIDDPRLDALWVAAAEAGLAVAIHSGDPRGFFEPIEPGNERYEELRQRPEYWFGDRRRFPALDDLHEQFERLVASHPATRFVGLHFGCFMDFADVARMLATYPNYMVDTAARTCDLAAAEHRDAVLGIFARFADRVVFGSDLIRTATYDLPDSGRDRRATSAFYDHHRLVFETGRDDIEPPFDFLPPRELHGLALPPDQLELLYHRNAVAAFGLDPIEVDRSTNLLGSRP